MRRIEHIWQRGFTWAVLGLSIFYAPFVVLGLQGRVDPKFAPLMRERLRSDLFGKDARAFAGAARPLANQLQARGVTWRETNRLSLNPYVGIVPVGEKLVDRFKVAYHQELNDLIEASRTNNEEATMGWRDFATLIRLPAMITAFAAREASSGNWHEVMKWEKVLVQIQQISARANPGASFIQTSLSGFYLSLLRAQPDTTATRELLANLDRLVLPPKPGEHPLRGILYSSLVDAEYSEWGLRDIADNVPFSESFISGALSLNALGSIQAFATSNLNPILVAGSPWNGGWSRAIGLNAFVPGRVAAAQRRSAVLVNRHGALQQDLAEFDGLMEGFSRRDLIAWLYSAAVGSRFFTDSSGYNLTGVTTMHLTRLAYAARLYRLETGHWPESLKDLAPKYIAELPQTRSALEIVPVPPSFHDLLAAPVKPLGPIKGSLFDLTTDTARDLVSSILRRPSELEQRRGDGIVISNMEKQPGGKILVGVVLSNAQTRFDIGSQQLHVDILLKSPSSNVTTATSWALPTQTLENPNPQWKAIDAATAYKITAEEDQFEKESARRRNVNEPAPVRMPREEFASAEIRLSILLPDKIYAIWSAGTDGVDNGGPSASLSILGQNVSDFVVYPQVW
ncbi:MAG: hypothetical protein K1X53_14300 [Candidatus Sumerlaeaceae bacterium]|nr:hypothetical protein [Candidatus Sumerlaeaceae bacterium]